jgi:hypothetical protein
MSLWEYKVITSGKGGFATPALLEKFLNDLGRDEWEIIHFKTPPDNFLAFTGLARRSTQRDWTLEDAAAAAAKVEAEKLRAEFEAKFKAAASNVPAGGAEEHAPSFLEEKIAPDDGFRKPVDTSHDDDPDAQEDEKADEWDRLTAAEQDDLPTFFEAIKPHMRRNQRGPGMSVGVDYLAKKWDQSEDDLKGALAECGFVLPEDEDAKAEYVEYDGDLYWLNVNRRGELWINTKEKPRPVFRPVKAARVEVEPPVAKDTGGARDEGRRKGERKPEDDERKVVVAEAGSGESEKAESATGEAVPVPAETRTQNGKAQAAATPLPEGPALLEKIRPHMRRNRRGPGGSGSASFLSRALRTNEADLRAAFATLGFTIPASSADKPVYYEIGNEVWWLNLDSRGGLWINGREKKEGESIAAPVERTGEAPLEGVPGSAAPDAVPAPEVAPGVAGAESFTAPTPADASTAEPSPAESAPTVEPARAAETASAAETTSPAETVPGADSAPPVPAETTSADQPVTDSTPTISDAGPLANVPPANHASAGNAAAISGEAETPAANEPPAESEPTTIQESQAPEPAIIRPISPNAALAAVRLLLKETKTGAVAGKVDRLADDLGKPADEFVATLVDAGLKVPEKPREKPVFVEHAGEILWLNRNTKGELWLNAKASRFSGKGAAADDTEESSEPSEGGEGESEKKPVRRFAKVRPKKTE